MDKSLPIGDFQRILTTARMKPDLESIVAFVRVVRARSFSAAARELDLSPSAISRRIARLESHLGVSLFSRTTRKLNLTEAGQEFYDRCSSSLSAIAEAEEAVSRFGTSPHGLLRVKVPQAFGRLHIAPTIPRFMSQHPNVKVDLLFRPLAGDFVDERIDVAVASRDPPNTGLSVKTLAPFERVTCAAPSYIEQAGKPGSVSELSKHNCLIFTGSDSVENEWVLYDEKCVQRVRVSGSFRTNDAEAMYMAVLAGMGVAHMPTFVVGPALSSGKLVPLFQDHGRSGAKMKAYYPPAKYRLPKVRAFIEFLVDIFKKQKWQS